MDIEFSCNCLRNCGKKIRIFQDEVTHQIQEHTKSEDMIIEITVSNDDGIYPVNCGIYVPKERLIQLLSEAQ